MGICSSTKKMEKDTINLHRPNKDAREMSLELSTVKVDLKRPDVSIVAFDLQDQQKVNSNDQTQDNRYQIMRPQAHIRCKEEEIKSEIDKDGLQGRSKQSFKLPRSLKTNENVWSSSHLSNQPSLIRTHPIRESNSSRDKSEMNNEEVYPTTNTTSIEHLFYLKSVKNSNFKYYDMTNVQARSPNNSIFIPIAQSSNQRSSTKVAIPDAFPEVKEVDNEELFNKGNDLDSDDKCLVSKTPLKELLPGEKNYLLVNDRGLKSLVPHLESSIKASSLIKRRREKKIFVPSDESQRQVLPDSFVMKQRFL